MAVRWFSMSTQFLTDPKVEDLGEVHGPAGPLVIVALLGRAKIANDAGRVSCSFRTLAHEAFTDRQEVAGILIEAAANGLLEILEMDDGEVKLRFPAFNKWQDAGRKAEEREARKPNAEANVQTRPEVSGPVPTDRQTDREDKTEKKNTSGKPSDFDLWLAHYHEVTGRTSITGNKEARKAFAARIKEGKTLEDLKNATVGCQSDGWRVQRGLNEPLTILRPSNVEKYISQAVDTPKTGAAAAPSKYDTTTRKVAA